MSQTLALPLRRAWLESLFWLLLAWAGIIVLLQPSAASMVSVWLSSETYAHGFVILPISLWLVWRNWRAFAAVPAAPDWRALVPALGLGSLWLAARVGGAQVVEHYALVGLLLTSFWAVYGVRLGAALLFPLAYLLFMVPSGDSLIDPLIDLTADFTVTAVRLIGIPVFREGVFFSLPSGDWSVVEACSGMRYLLASLALGWLYAYLTYRSLWKQIAFGIASLLVPILANGIRAALIVLIGHYSGMELAVGVDHLIYGWVWFGVVMTAMFWMGNRWREDDQPEAEPGPILAPAPAGRMVTALLLLLALLPWYEGHLQARSEAPSPLAGLPAAAGWAAAPQALTHWQPDWRGASDEATLYLEQGADRVMLHAAWYGAQRQGRELINSANRTVQERNPVWRRTSERALTLPDGRPARESLVDARGNHQRLLVWYWNRIDGENAASPFRAKARLALDKLLGQPDAGALVLIAAPYQDSPEEASAVLGRFLAERGPALDRLLDRP